MRTSMSRLRRDERDAEAAHRNRVHTDAMYGRRSEQAGTVTPPPPALRTAAQDVVLRRVASSLRVLAACVVHPAVPASNTKAGRHLMCKEHDQRRCLSAGRDWRSLRYVFDRTRAIKLRVISVGVPPATYGSKTRLHSRARGARCADCEAGAGRAEVEVVLRNEAVEWVTSTDAVQLGQIEWKLEEISKSQVKSHGGGKAVWADYGRIGLRRTVRNSDTLLQLNSHHLLRLILNPSRDSHGVGPDDTAQPSVLEMLP
ncbi:hypothetical protein R3P38DRAFT_3593983 [Favolaschia claudopus]|uniref:Uncharacterized protein n=1 Tax=Favolaschia claudopus TaxID=2862362 RepID=A0AAW0DKZ2_9AGAR